jgi:thiamine-phosphate pyrophosphorylase
MSPALNLPRLYAVLDPSILPIRDSGGTAIHFAEELLDAGVELLQLRDKRSPSRQVLSLARELRRINRGRAMLIMNDRADLCLAADFSGVHLGQEDLSPPAARRILDQQTIIGCSTHNLEQVREADQSPADYIALGPIFETRSKERPDPVIGVEALRKARRLTSKPLVAIGGITPENCAAVLEAGADSVAVISSLLESPRKTVEQFHQILG